jgi:hypothetical protein
VDYRRNPQNGDDAGDSRITSYAPRFEFTVWIGAGFPTTNMKSGFNAEKYAAGRYEGPIAWVGTNERICFPAGWASIPNQSRAVGVENECGNNNAFAHPPNPIGIPVLFFRIPSVLSLPHARCEQQNENQRCDAGCVCHKTSANRPTRLAMKRANA